MTSLYKTLWTLVVVLVLLGVAGAVWYGFATRPTVQTGTGTSQTYPVNQNTYTVSPQQTNTSTSNSNTLELQTRVGAITVKDFIHNGETVADIENLGRYVLAGSLGYCIANVGCPSGATTTDFSIVYVQTDQTFHITLLAEPLDKSRQDAAAFLADRLGVKPPILCALFYFVEVPYSLNPIYANKNLGFDFCPGATSLQ